MKRAQLAIGMAGVAMASMRTFRYEEVSPLTFPPQSYPISISKSDVDAARREVNKRRRARHG